MELPVEKSGRDGGAWREEAESAHSCPHREAIAPRVGNGLERTVEWLGGDRPGVDEEDGMNERLRPWAVAALPADHTDAHDERHETAGPGDC